MQFAPSSPDGLLKRKHGKQKATSFVGEYSSHEGNNLNQVY